ncbi:MAG TPA: cyclic nucleotide-binding domain-containing protein [Puia sp.]|nr:cyclic nucleotide-binding domain-containing protein [Puia sp.]
MEHTKLRNYLQRFSPLPDSDWDFFVSRLQQRIFRKKELILAAGKVEQYVNFIDSGIIRYFIVEEEKDITFEIAFESSFATAYDSFLTRMPVRYSGEALTDTVLWSIGYGHLQEMYARTTVGDRIGRLAAEELYIRKNQRQMSLLKDGAELRYKALMRDYPHLLRHVPLKYLASFIGNRAQRRLRPGRSECPELRRRSPPRP